MVLSMRKPICLPVAAAYLALVSKMLSVVPAAEASLVSLLDDDGPHCMVPTMIHIARVVVYVIMNQLLFPIL